MEFCKNKKQYVDAILYDGDITKNDLMNFIEGFGIDVQHLGFIHASYLPEGESFPVLEGTIKPSTTIHSFYLVYKRKQIISVPVGHYITWNGKTIKVVPAYDFEKEWDKVRSNESQYTIEDQDEED